MAIPSGSGTEVLKRSFIHANSNAWTNLVTGVANHIYIVLSITFNEQAGAAEDIRLRVDTNASGSDEIAIYGSGIATLPANGTFVWNDKVVIHGQGLHNAAQKIVIGVETVSFDISLSYIDQDWT